MMRLCLLVLVTMLTGAGALVAAEDWRRRPMQVHRTEDLCVVTPVALPDAERLAARAQAIYDRLQADSGLEPRRRLWLVLDDRSDGVDGFSTVIPTPVVFVNLAPAGPQSELFAGGATFELILVHELVHHLANEDPNWVTKIFGRPLPTDPLSLLTFLATVPNHATMPRFWQEGLAQWAETAYLDDAGHWVGRGRSALVHAIWRLDVAADDMPHYRDWRLSRPDWPFGSVVYHYGVAYLRHLVQATGVDVWTLLREQQEQQIYLFREGSTDLLGRNHHALLNEAQAALRAEQTAVIEHLRGTPLTPTPRLHPQRYLAGVPAWGADGEPVAIVRDVLGDSDLVRLDAADGDLDTLEDDVFGIHLRAAADGTLVYQRRTFAGEARIGLWRDGDCEHLPALRWRFPALAHLGGDRYRLAGLEILPGARQRLVVADLHWGDGDPELLGAPRVVADAGLAWDPALSADGRRLAWLVSAPAGMSLRVCELGAELAAADLGTSREWWSVPGRLAHPAWDAEGGIYVCSDRSGVFNAYRVVADGEAGGSVEPVTHVLGAVTACVPSADGRTLALRVLDHEGFHLSLLDAGAERPEELPTIELTWTPEVAPEAFQLPEPDPEARVPGRRYRAITRLRPQWWTPVLVLSTTPTADTGIGIQTRFADPLGRMSILASGGLANPGSEDREAVVGSFTWSWNRHVVDVFARGWREVETYAGLQQIPTDDVFDYAETRLGASVGIGRSWSFAHWGWGGAGGFTLELGTQRFDELANDAPRPWRPNVLGPDIFEGDERFARLALTIGDTDRSPRSFGPLVGWQLFASYRRSGFGGDLERHQGSFGASGWLPIWRRRDLVLELDAVVGASEGDDTLQRTFILGSEDTRAVGDHFLRYTVGLRIPVWRPFRYWGTSPGAFRQLVVTPFITGAQLNDDHPFADEGDWYQVAGVRIEAEWEVDLLRLAPGLVIGQQLDHDEEAFVAFTLRGF